MMKKEKSGLYGMWTNEVYLYKVKPPSWSACMDKINRSSYIMLSNMLMESMHITSQQAEVCGFCPLSVRKWG